MNHRFLGKCRRGSARSTASKWRLPITQSSDLNMTYIIAFCGGSVVEHHITTQKKKKKPESCPDLRGHTLSYNSHIAFMVKVFARIRESRLDRPQNYIHNWKWNIKCHIFLWFNLKSIITIMTVSQESEGLRKEPKCIWLYMWVTLNKNEWA